MLRFRDAAAGDPNRHGTFGLRKTRPEDRRTYRQQNEGDWQQAISTYERALRDLACTWIFKAQPGICVPQ